MTLRCTMEAVPPASQHRHRRRSSSHRDGPSSRGGSSSSSSSSSSSLHRSLHRAASTTASDAAVQTSPALLRKPEQAADLQLPEPRKGSSVGLSSLLSGFYLKYLGVLDSKENAAARPSGSASYRGTSKLPSALKHGDKPKPQLHRSISWQSPWQRGKPGVRERASSLWPLPDDAVGTGTGQPAAEAAGGEGSAARAIIDALDAQAAASPEEVLLLARQQRRPSQDSSPASKLIAAVTQQQQQEQEQRAASGRGEAGAVHGRRRRRRTSSRELPDVGGKEGGDDGGKEGAAIGSSAENAGPNGGGGRHRHGRRRHADAERTALGPGLGAVTADGSLLANGPDARSLSAPLPKQSQQQHRRRAHSREHQPDHPPTHHHSSSLHHGEHQRRSVSAGATVIV